MNVHADEVTFYEDNYDDILLTDKRLVLKDKEFSLENVDDVHVSTQVISSNALTFLFFGGLTLILSLLILQGLNVAFWIGLISMIAGVIIAGLEGRSDVVLIKSEGQAIKINMKGAINKDMLLMQFKEAQQQGKVMEA